MLKNRGKLFRNLLCPAGGDADAYDLWSDGRVLSYDF